MPLKIRISERDNDIQNGLYDKYDILAEVLGGHPYGISSINVSKDMAAIVIARPHEKQIVNWEESKPTQIEPIRGKPSISIGQDIDTRLYVLARITLRPGESVSIRNQGQDMTAEFPKTR